MILTTIVRGKRFGSERFFSIENKFISLDYNRDYFYNISGVYEFFETSFLSLFCLVIMEEY